MERKTNLDIMRGIGMLCVMLAHTAVIDVSFILPFEIPVFWFISGYLMHDSKSIYTKTIWNRIGKSFKEYVLYNSIILMAFVFIHHISIKEILWAIVGIIYSRFALFPMGNVNNIYFLTIQNAPLWFLTSKMVIDLIVIIIIRRKYNITMAMIIALIFSMCLQKFPILLPWSIDTVGVGILFTLLGYVFCSHSEFIEERYKNWYVIIWGVLYGVCIFINPNANISIRYYGDGHLSYIVYIVSASIGIMIMWKIIKLIGGYFPKIIVSVLVMIGRNTLPILGLHYFLYCTLDIIKERFHIEVNEVFWGIYKITFSIIFCVLFGKVQEKCLEYYYKKHM